MYISKLHKKISANRYSLRRALLVFTRSNLDNKLDDFIRTAVNFACVIIFQPLRNLQLLGDVCLIACDNGFKVQEINNLFLYIANKKNSRKKFNWQKYKLHTLQYIPRFLGK